MSVVVVMVPVWPAMHSQSVTAVLAAEDVAWSGHEEQASEPVLGLYSPSKHAEHVSVGLVIVPV